MKFDEWFETLETRDQRRADKDLLKESWEAAQKDMREQAAKLCDTEASIVGEMLAEEVRELEIK